MPFGDKRHLYIDDYARKLDIESIHFSFMLQSLHQIYDIYDKELTQDPGFPILLECTKKYQTFEVSPDVSNPIGLLFFNETAFAKELLIAILEDKINDTKTVDEKIKAKKILVNEVRNSSSIEEASQKMMTQIKNAELLKKQSKKKK